MHGDSRRDHSAQGNRVFGLTTLIACLANYSADVSRHGIAAADFRKTLFDTPDTVRAAAQTFGS